MNIYDESSIMYDRRSIIYDKGKIYVINGYYIGCMCVVINKGISLRYTIFDKGFIVYSKGVQHTLYDN